MERMRTLMVGYDELREGMERKGYQLTRLKEFPLQGKIACRLVQFAIGFVFACLGMNDILHVLSGEFKSADSGALFAFFTLAIIFCLFAEVVARSMPSEGSGEKYLPVSGFFAKRWLRAEFEDLRSEIGRLDALSSSVMMDFKALKAIAEEELRWNCVLKKESGKKACMEIRMPNKSDDDRRIGMTKYEIINAEYAIDLDGLVRFATDIALALEWRKVKLRETEIVEKFMKERLKRG